jgi:ABC-type multidrug transport system permease subunit
MRLLDIIWKEISVIKSQKIALLLIFLYPLLAIFLLGMGMSGVNLNSMSINVGLVDNLPSDMNLIERISEQNQNLNIINFSDSNELLSSLKRKEIMVGLVANSNGKLPIILDLYYDNSNLAAGGSFRSFAVSNIGLVELNIVKENFTAILDIIFGLKSNLNSQLSQITEFKTKLNDSSKELDNLEAKLNSFDVNKIESTLNTQEKNINDFEKKNQDFLRELASFKLAFSNVKEELDDLKNSLEKYDTKLSELSNQLDTLILNVDGIILNYGSVLGSEGVAKLEEQKNDLIEFKETVDSLRNLMNELSNDQSNLNQTVNNADALFTRLEIESKSVAAMLKDSSGSISEMNSDLVVFKDSLDEVRQLIVSSRKSKTEIESKLNNSESLFSNLANEMNDLDSLDKSVLSDPIKIIEKRTFSPKSLNYMLSPIDPLLIGGVVANAISIVLIMTCLLLTSIIVILERNENVALRFMLSPTSKFELILGKILGQLVIAMSEATIIFIIAIFVFGSDLLTRFVEIYFITIIIATAFICLGLLVSSFTKTQSTAILLSLLAIIPMLFLSGIIVPLDLMAPFMQMASLILPLTAANNLLLGIIVKDLAFFDSIIELSVLFAIILIGILVTLLKDNY